MIALTPRDLAPNWYALAMAILADCTPDHKVAKRNTGADGGERV